MAPTVTDETAATAAAAAAAKLNRQRAKIKSIAKMKYVFIKSQQKH